MYKPVKMKEISVEGEKIICLVCSSFDTKNGWHLSIPFTT